MNYRTTIFGIILSMISFKSVKSQELFVYTEPASNMPSKSIGLRLTNRLMQSQSTNKVSYEMQPEFMWGISKKIMIHAEGFFSNVSGTFKTDGVASYLKYRFYTQDEVHKHFRLAAFIRGSYNANEIQQESIDLNGVNSGYEAGMIATKLVNKLALSITGSFLHAADNGNSHKFPLNNGRNAISYSLSAGKLVLPVNYTNYRQTNVNVMAEILAQTNLKSARTFIDFAPSVQLIILSKMRLEAGYRFAVVKDLERTAVNGFLLRFEYDLFSVFK